MDGASASTLPAQWLPMPVSQELAAQPAQGSPWMGPPPGHRVTQEGPPAGTQARILGWLCVKSVLTGRQKSFCLRAEEGHVNEEAWCLGTQPASRGQWASGCGSYVSRKLGLSPSTLSFGADQADEGMGESVGWVLGLLWASPVLCPGSRAPSPPRLTAPPWSQVPAGLFLPRAFRVLNHQRVREELGGRALHPGEPAGERLASDKASHLPLPHTPAPSYAPA